MLGLNGAMPDIPKIQIARATAVANAASITPTVVAGMTQLELGSFQAPLSRRLSTVRIAFLPG
ncbi:MAG TPA: hypothetical protein VHK26_03680 [Methyloceanibacter sp.]|nr:hypothetical protein [Methyloceanibacter sp.]